MIQRIQSILLLLVSILMGLSVVLPLWGKADGTNKVEITAIQMIQTSAGTTVMEQTTIYLAIIAGLTAVLAFWNIFNFKNRGFQMKISLFCTLLISAFIATEFFISHNAISLFSPEVEGHFGSGFFLPVAAILFNWLALRAIKRDDDMVRSADRLR